MEKDKRHFYADGIALSLFSMQLHQIVDTYSSRHTSNILPKIYRSADGSSPLIGHFINKIEKVRANIASEHGILTSTLLLQTFHHLKSVAINRQNIHFKICSKKV